MKNTHKRLFALAGIFLGGLLWAHSGGPYVGAN